MDEASLLSVMRAALPPRGLESPDLQGAPWGDDAALLHPSWLEAGHDLVLTQDLLIEDIDFRWAWATPEQVGFKALQVNLSDLAAKGAVPRYALISCAVDRPRAAGLLPRLYAGIGEAIDDSGVVVVGGDLSASPGPVMIDITLVGTCPRGEAWTRNAAKVGDQLWISRPVGLARLGLLAMERQLDAAQLDGQLELLVEALVRPRAELSLSRQMRAAGYHGACMDLSDGLLSDLPRLCAASGVGARVTSHAIPRPGALIEGCKFLGVYPLRTALEGGEDFALLGAASPAEVARLNAYLTRQIVAPVVVIGTIVPAEEGLSLEVSDGFDGAWPENGFDHFDGRADL